MMKPEGRGTHTHTTHKEGRRTHTHQHMPQIHLFDIREFISR